MNLCIGQIEASTCPPRFVCCMTKKSWAFSDPLAVISAALRLLFIVNTLTVFLSFCYTGIYKDFVRQLKVFPPSFCHFCACEMSPGWGHLIIWMDPSVGHLNGSLARVGGNLNNHFQKSQMPGGLPRGDVEASIWPIHYRVGNFSFVFHWWSGFQIISGSDTRTYPHLCQGPQA